MIRLLRNQSHICGRTLSLCFPNGFAALLLVGVAVACLAAVATAQAPAPSVPATNSPSRTALGPSQGLVRAAETQFRIAFRNDLDEHDRRREQLAAAVAAWRAAARSATNDRLLTDWLRTAIRASMPGSHEPLPELPKFEQPVVSRPAVTTPATGTTSTTRQKPVVESSGAASGKAPSPRPVVAHPSMDHESIRSVTTSTSTSSKSSSAHESAAAPDEEQNFWSAHPANGELPASLSSDPFRDDP